MLVCARMKLREVDDTPYDASEKESVFERDEETEAIYLEEALPILDSQRQNRQQRSASEPKPKRKTSWPGKRTLRRRPVPMRYSSSDEEFGEGGTRETVRKARVAKRRASWPKPPLTPKAHDSGVQGLGDTDINTGSGRGEGSQKETQNRGKRKEKQEDVLPEIGLDGEEEQALMFRGIADADSSEERWTQIVLEEHMDKIFNAVPKPPSEEQMGERVEDKEARDRFERVDEWGLPCRRKPGWRKEGLMILRFFGWLERFKRQGI
jgi:hypothetical protein